MTKIKNKVNNSTMNYKQTYLSKITNTIYLITSVLILSFIWINFYLHNLQIAVTASVIITITFCLLYFLLHQFIKNRKNNILNQQKNLENLKNQILYGNDRDTIDKLLIAFNISDTQYTNSPNHLFNNQNKQDYYFLFETECINNEQLISIYKNRKFNEIHIFCINHGITSIPSDITLKIHDLKSICNQLYISKTTIDNYIKLQKKPRIRAKDVFCTVFKRDRAKSYIGFGLLLIFSSLFTPFSTYYIIMGTILILLSIYCRFNKYFNQKNTDNY